MKHYRKGSLILVERLNRALEKTGIYTLLGTHCSFKQLYNQLIMWQKCNAKKYQGLVQLAAVCLLHSSVDLHQNHVFLLFFFEQSLPLISSPHRRFFLFVYCTFPTKHSTSVFVANVARIVMWYFPQNTIHCQAI